jgi:hypothetical protein
VIQLGHPVSNMSVLVIGGQCLTSAWNSISASVSLSLKKDFINNKIIIIIMFRKD